MLSEWVLWDNKNSLHIRWQAGLTPFDRQYSFNLIGLSKYQFVLNEISWGNSFYIYLNLVKYKICPVNHVSELLMILLCRWVIISNFIIIIMLIIDVLL